LIKIIKDVFIFIKKYFFYPFVKIYLSSRNVINFKINNISTKNYLILIEIATILSIYFYFKYFYSFIHFFKYLSYFGFIFIIILEIVNYYFDLKLDLLTTYFKFELKKKNIFNAVFFFFFFFSIKWFILLFLFFILFYYFFLFKLIFDINFNLFFKKTKKEIIVDPGLKRYEIGYLTFKEYIFFFLYHYPSVAAFYTIYFPLKKINTLRLKDIFKILYYRFIGIPYTIFKFTFFFTEVLMESTRFEHYRFKYKIVWPVIFVYETFCWFKVLLYNKISFFCILPRFKHKIIIIEGNLILNDKHRSVLIELTKLFITKNPNFIPVTQSYYLKGRNHVGIGSTFDINQSGSSLNTILTSSKYIYTIGKEKVPTNQESLLVKQQKIISMVDNILIKNLEEKSWIVNHNEYLKFSLKIKNDLKMLNKVSVLLSNNDVILYQTFGAPTIKRLQELRSEGLLSKHTERFINEGSLEKFNEVSNIIKIKHERDYSDEELANLVNYYANLYDNLNIDEAFDLTADSIIDLGFWNSSKESLLEEMRNNNTIKNSKGDIII